MAMLTYLVNAEIKDAAQELDGKILTRPTLLVTDGVGLVYASDVDIGEGKVLRNVPVAQNNRELMYSEVGSAVRLRRTASGRYEIVGLSKEMPGTFTRLPVNLNDFTFGQIEDLTLTAVAIPYGDLAAMGYGSVAYGSVAVYKGGTLIEVRA